MTAWTAAYAYLRKGDVSATVPVSDDVMIDVDSTGAVLGVEVLDDSDWRDALVTLVMQGRLKINHD